MLTLLLLSKYNSILRGFVIYVAHRVDLLTYFVLYEKLVTIRRSPAQCVSSVNRTTNYNVAFVFCFFSFHAAAAAAPVFLPPPVQLKDRETREFIYDFIQNHKVLDTMKSEQSGNNRKQRPPPVPIRNHHEQTQQQQVGSRTGSWSHRRSY